MFLSLCWSRRIDGTMRITTRMLDDSVRRDIPSFNFVSTVVHRLIRFASRFKMLFHHALRHQIYFSLLRHACSGSLLCAQHVIVPSASKMLRSPVHQSSFLSTGLLRAPWKFDRIDSSSRYGLNIGVLLSIFLTFCDRGSRAWCFRAAVELRQFSAFANSYRLPCATFALTSVTSLLSQ